MVGEKTHTQRSALRECAQQCVHATEGWVERDFQIDLHIHSLLKQNRLRIRVTRARWWAFSNPTLRDHPPHHTDGHSSHEPEPHPGRCPGREGLGEGHSELLGEQESDRPVKGRRILSQDPGCPMFSTRQNWGDSELSADRASKNKSSDDSFDV